MIRVSAKKTLAILEFILNNSTFTQTDIKNSTKSSIGLVNRIVNWLLDKGFITKPSTKYLLTRPNRLVELISIQTTMKLVQTYEISLSKKKTLELIKKNKGILCLHSALEIHSKHSHPELHIYLPNPKLKSMLDNSPRGSFKINIYTSDLELTTPNIVTDELRTIIDFCAMNMHSSVEKLALKKWGTMQ